MSGDDSTRDPCPSTVAPAASTACPEEEIHFSRRSTGIDGVEVAETASSSRVWPFGGRFTGSVMV